MNGSGSPRKKNRKRSFRCFPSTSYSFIIELELIHPFIEAYKVRHILHKIHRYDINKDTSISIRDTMEQLTNCFDGTITNLEVKLICDYLSHKYANSSEIKNIPKTKKEVINSVFDLRCRDYFRKERRIENVDNSKIVVSKYKQLLKNRFDVILKKRAVEKT
jgi:hypothetical protein